MGTNVFGFGAFEYRVRFGTRVEERKCHEMRSNFAPTALADVVVIVVKLDYFDAITREADPTARLNPFELMVHRGLIEQGAIDGSNRGAFRVFPTTNAEQYIVGLVIPLHVIKALPGRIVRLRQFGVEVALAGVEFPSPDNIEAAQTIRSIVNSSVSGDHKPPQGLYGEWFMVTEEISNVWWVYDKIKGAVPITSVSIEGVQSEIIRYTVYQDRHTNTPVLEVTSSTLLELNDMELEDRIARFGELGVFRTENEAIASGEAHNGLLDHRLKVLGYDKVKAEIGRHERTQERADRKFETDEEYRRLEEERKAADAREKRKQEGVRQTKSIMEMLRVVIDTVAKAVTVWVLVTKTFGLFQRDANTV